MRDEIFDRDYQQGRDAMNDGIDRGLARLAAHLRTVGETLHRVQWSAPWRSERKGRNRTGIA
jgi:hypothetical protein